MHRFVVQMRDWLVAGPGRQRGGAEYEVPCLCGQAARGSRRAAHQIVPCPSCGRKLFVFPRSPLPSVALGPEGGAPFFNLLGRAWLLPLGAAGLTLAIVVAIFVVVLSHLGRAAPSRSDDINRRIATGRKALNEGNFHVAEENLKAACELRDQNANLLPAVQGRELTRLYRQAALLDDLLSESLAEIVLKAVDERGPEWQADFERRYQGKAVVFEGWMRWDAAAGKFHLDYPILAGDEQVRLDLGDLKLLQRLPPLDNPQLVLFGARLASVRRDANGGWLIRFDPDSGVFLTDLGAAAACCSRPLDDDLRAVLDQQTRWDEANP